LGAHAALQGLKMKNKTFTAEFTKAADTNVFTFIASNESVDSDGDVVLVDGWQLNRFNKNPVILFGHDRSKPPVGKAVAVRKILAEDKRLEIDIEFANTPFAK